MRVLWVLGLVVVLVVMGQLGSSSEDGSVRGAEVGGHERLGREALSHKEEELEVEAEEGTDPKVEFKFKRVDYQWKSKAQKQRFEKKGKYIPKNNVITGVKVYNSPEGDTKYFVTVPRWRTGVPSTLNLLVKNKDYEKSSHDDDEEEFILRPWPSWRLQKAGDPDAMQYVQSMEIDTVGRMWVIDAGRRNFLQPSKTVNGPPKLFIFDIDSESLVRLFVFPNAVAPWSSSFLNDIVISPSGTSAFISDTGEGIIGGLIAYDFNLNQARRLEDKSTRAEKEASDFRINGRDYTFNNPSDGIALHPDGEQLFYCALTGYHVYRVSATLFGDFSVPIEQVRKTIELIGRKVSQSDGMTFSNKGILYFGALQLNAVYHWDPSSGVKSNGDLKDQKALIQSNKGVQWVDTFAFDNQRERLVFTSNRLQKYFFNQTDLNEVSMRIWSVDINAQSYQQGPSF